MADDIVAIIYVPAAFLKSLKRVFQRAGDCGPQIWERKETPLRIETRHAPGLSFFSIHDPLVPAMFAVSPELEDTWK